MSPEGCTKRTQSNVLRRNSNQDCSGSPFNRLNSSSADQFEGEALKSSPAGRISSARSLARPVSTRGASFSVTPAERRKLHQKRRSDSFTARDRVWRPEEEEELAGPTGELASFNLRAPAETRRKSWRQGARSKSGQPAEQSGPKDAQEGPHKRLPAAQFGTTFELDHQEPSPKANVRQPDTGAQCSRLQRWLAQAGSGALALAKEQTVGDKLGWCGWPLDARGKYGESLLHVLLINGSSEHLVLALLLLHLWPNLLFDLFESDKFAGLGCLHVTIASRNVRLLQFLLDFCTDQHQVGRLAKSRAHLVEQQVTGSLFRSPFLTPSGGPRGSRVATQCLGQHLGRLFGQRRVWAGRRSRVAAAAGPAGAFWCDSLQHWPAAQGARHLFLWDRLVGGRGGGAQPKGQDGGSEEAGLGWGLVYLGHTALAWALHLEQREACELLALHCSASLDAPDQHGDTCLHQLIVNQGRRSRLWLRFLVRQLGASLQTRNRLGLTPFQLAAHLGRVQLFEEMLEMSAVEYWSYSSVSCCGYSLASLDSLAPNLTQTRSRSAIEVILESQESTNEQKSALLSGTVVLRLLDEKWTHFARRLFLRDLALSLAQLSLLTVAIGLRGHSLDRGKLHEKVVSFPTYLNIPTYLTIPNRPLLP